MRYATIGLSLFSAGCLCDKRTLAEIESQQGVKARVLSVDCGATTDFAMNVEVGGFIGGTVVLATRGTEQPSVEFVDGGKTLLVSVPRSVPDRHVYPHASVADGVKIVVRRP
jgi:hypothetical protein